MGVLRRTMTATLIVGTGLMVAGPAGAAPAGTAKDLTPIFECAAPNSDGTSSQRTPATRTSSVLATPLAVGAATKVVGGFLSVNCWLGCDASPLPSTSPTLSPWVAWTTLALIARLARR